MIELSGQCLSRAEEHSSNSQRSDTAIINYGWFLSPFLSASLFEVLYKAFFRHVAAGTAG